MKRFTIILVALTLVLSLCGCGALIDYSNSYDPDEPSDCYDVSNEGDCNDEYSDENGCETDTDTEKDDEESISPSTAPSSSDSIGKTPLKNGARRAIENPVEHKTFSSDKVEGNIAATNQSVQYEYTAVRSGIYSIQFVADNVNFRIGFSVKDQKGKEIVSKKLSDEEYATFRLDKGNRYYFTVKNDSSIGGYYQIQLNVPDETKRVGNRIEGSMRYKDEEDVYIFTSGEAGVYGFRASMPMLGVWMSIIDPKGKTVYNALLQDGVEHTARLDANTDYSICFTYYSNPGEYEMDICPQNPRREITGSMTDSIRFVNEVDNYLFHANESRTYTISASTPYSPALYITVYDETARQIQCGYLSPTLNAELESGHTYLIDVTSPSFKDYNYTLTID